MYYSMLLNVLHVECAVSSNLSSSASLFCKFGEDFMLVSLCKVIGSRTQDDKFLILLRDTVGVLSDLPISIQALGNVRA